jgi:hypothetical protein
MVRGEPERADHRISMTSGDDKIKLEGYSTVKLRPYGRPQLLGPWHLCAPGEPDYRIEGDGFAEKQTRIPGRPQPHSSRSQWSRLAGLD